MDTAPGACVGFLILEVAITLLIYLYTYLFLNRFQHDYVSLSIVSIWQTFPSENFPTQVTYFFSVFLSKAVSRLGRRRREQRLA